MATDTAATALPASREPDPTRHVWQVPVFLLGSAVFAAAWQGWLPLGAPDPAAAFAGDVASLRTAAERTTPDRGEVQELLAKVAAGVDAYPEYAAAARFALGSGYARLAELSPAPDEARAYWTLARQHFELVNDRQLKDPNDPPRLAFRAAKARAAVGYPPGTPATELKLCMTILERVPPFGEEPGEAGRLEADLAMRLSPPDTQTAKEALFRYLQSSGSATPAPSLARAKYQLGDVCFRRGEPELARKWLVEIGADAPAEIVVPAKFLLARVRMKEEDWLGAAKDLEAVRTLPGVPAATRLAAAFHLGVCKANTGEWEAAAKAFEEAVAGEGPEAVAAAVKLADLHLKVSQDPARRALAADLLARAVRGVSAPAGYRNGYVKLPELQAVFELAVAALLRDESYEPAVAVANSYAAVAAPGRDREKRAEALAAWAAALQKKGGDYKPKAAAAAKEFATLAESQAPDSAKADSLRRAAEMDRLAGDPRAAAAALQAATRLKLDDAAAGPVWAELAEALAAAGGEPKDVLKAFNEAMAAGGPVSTAVRYQLARQLTDARRPGLGTLGRGLFEQIARLETVAPDDQKYHERALVELAHEFIRAGNFPEAETWLRKQLSVYPTGPEASLGRLLLGVCLLQRSDAPPAGPDAAAALRGEAVKLFKQIVTEADAKQKRDGKLTDRDAWLRLQAGLRVLQAYQRMQRPNDLLAEAAPLLDRHRGTVEELIILSLAYHAYKQKNETGKAFETRDRMKELFDRLPPAAFPQASGEYSRSYWEKVWFAPESK